MEEEAEAEAEEEAEAEAEEDVGEVCTEEELNEMPDSWEKYEMIVRRAKAGHGLYTDIQFPADDTSLGENTAE